MVLPHRIAAGALVLHRDKLLLLSHHAPGGHTFWAPPGGGVEGTETLEQAAERETFEETGLRIAAQNMAYFDELIDASGRMVKFWFLARFLSGTLDLSANPAPGEHIAEAGWFGRDDLPDGHVFPAVLRDRFWHDRADGFASPIRLPLMTSIF